MSVPAISTFSTFIDQQALTYHCVANEPAVECFIDQLLFYLDGKRESA